MPIIGDPLIIGSGGQYAFFGPGTEYLGRQVNKTINLKNDTTYDSWTASTTAGTIADTPSSYDLDYSTDPSYIYYFIGKLYVDIAYLAGATLQNAAKRFLYLNITMVYRHFSSLSSLTNNTYSSSTNINMLNRNNLLYYDSNGSLAFSVTNMGPMYGAAISSTSTGSDYFRMKRGQISARCNATYFDVARKQEVDSANTNMIQTVDVYRTPMDKSFSNWFQQTCRTDIITGIS